MADASRVSPPGMVVAGRSLHLDPAPYVCASLVRPTVADPLFSSCSFERRTVLAPLCRLIPLFGRAWVSTPEWSIP